MKDTNAALKAVLDTGDLISNELTSMFLVELVSTGKLEKQDITNLSGKTNAVVQKKISDLIDRLQRL